jgi:hypothetical protein
VDTAKALSFPPEAANDNQLHLEVLSVLGTTTLELQPQSEANTTYIANFNSNGNDGMSCILDVARASVQAELANPGKLRVHASSAAARRHEATKSSEQQAYLDRTELLQVVQEAMKATIDSQPECPLQHLAEILLSKALHDTHAEKTEVADMKDTSQPADNSTDEGPDSPPRRGVTSDTRLSGSDSEDVVEPPSVGFSDITPVVSLASRDASCEMARKLMPTKEADQCAKGALDACLIQVPQAAVPKLRFMPDDVGEDPQAMSTDRDEGSVLLDMNVMMHPLNWQRETQGSMTGALEDEDLEAIDTYRDDGSALPVVAIRSLARTGAGEAVCGVDGVNSRFSQS